MDNHQDAAKRDEESMLKQIVKRNTEAEKDKKERLDKEMRIKEEAGKTLAMQMKEKQQEKILSRQQDAMYADQITKHNMIAANEEK